VVIHEIKERTSGLYRGLLVDDDGQPIPRSALLTLTLTLYNEGTADGAIINARDAQDCLAPGSGVEVLDPPVLLNGVLHNLTWDLSPEDSPIQDPDLRYERHIALFTFTYGAAREGHHEVIITVRNLRKVGDEEAPPPP
jgi:hypothetical protein